MIEIISAIICSSMLSFCLGWIYGRKKFSKQTAVQVIENLKATMKVYDITHKEQITFLSQKYTDLKINVLKCLDDNKALKEEITKLKKPKI